MFLKYALCVCESVGYFSALNFKTCRLIFGPALFYEFQLIYS